MQIYQRQMLFFKFIEEINKQRHQLYKSMRPNKSKKPIFVQIGRNLTTSKPANRRQSQSFASSHLPTHPNPSNNIINQTQPLLPNRRKISQTNSSINKTYALVSNINDDYLFMRKENYLNTKFNIRKNKLKEITKQNKQLHQRINSQKSFYSSTDLNKSFESNLQIKKRLSQSKLSQRINSSRSSSRSKIDSSKGNRFEKKDVKIAIKAKNINETKSNDLQVFKGLFNHEVSSVKNEQKNEKDSISFKSYRVNDAYTRPLKGLVRRSIQQSRGSMIENEGGLLHRIAQEMISKQKPKKMNFKQKKMFNF